MPSFLPFRRSLRRGREVDAGEAGILSGGLSRRRIAGDNRGGLETRWAKGCKSCWLKVIMSRAYARPSKILELRSLKTAREGFNGARVGMEEEERSERSRRPAKIRERSLRGISSEFRRTRWCSLGAIRNFSPKLRPRRVISPQRQRPDALSPLRMHS